MNWYEAKGEAAACLRQRKHSPLRQFQILLAPCPVRLPSLTVAVVSRTVTARNFQCRPDCLLVLAEHGSRLGPARVHIGQVKPVTEVARSRVPRMRHQVNLGKAGHLHVPSLRLPGVVLQQGARLVAAIQPLPLFPFVGPQPLLDGSGTDLEPLLLQFRPSQKRRIHGKHWDKSVPTRHNRPLPRRPASAVRRGDRKDRLGAGDQPKAEPAGVDSRS
jgi:hypothetical protein